MPDAKFIAHCAKDNVASAKVLEKLGFRVTGEVDIHIVSLDASMPSFEFELK